MSRELNRPERIALWIELAVAGALLVLLGVAAGRFLALLERIEVPRLTALPIAALFVGAAWIAARRVARVWRLLRGGSSNDRSRNRG